MQRRRSSRANWSAYLIAWASWGLRTFSSTSNRQNTGGTACVPAPKSTTGWSVQLHTQIQTHTHAHTGIHTHRRAHTHTKYIGVMCTHTNTHTHTHTHTHNTHTHTHTHMHTHAHTHRYTDTLVTYSTTKIALLSKTFIYSSAISIWHKADVFPYDIKQMLHLIATFVCYSSYNYTPVDVHCWIQFQVLFLHEVGVAPCYSNHCMLRSHSLLIDWCMLSNSTTVSIWRG